MKRNRQLLLPDFVRPEPSPGLIYCNMYSALGWGLGLWRMRVVIDPDRKEYNTSVYLSGPSLIEIPGGKADAYKDGGFDLKRYELMAILRLYKSRRFRHFLMRNHSEIVCDAGTAELHLFSSEKNVRLYSMGFDFFRRKRIPKTRFELGAWWWTRGLKNIFKKSS